MSPLLRCNLGVVVVVLIDKDLSGANLFGAVGLTAANLAGASANLQNADLRGTGLTYQQLRNAGITAAKLTGAMF